MYIEGGPAYKWHQEHFGHQSKVGFKDVIPTFKGEKFDLYHDLPKDYPAQFSWDDSGSGLQQQAERGLRRRHVPAGFRAWPGGRHCAQRLADRHLHRRLALLMGQPGKQAVVASLAAKGKLEVGKIRDVELLGYKGKLKWTQDEAGLKVEMPEEKPSDHAVTLKVVLG
jgi:hypothetical protein